MSSTRLLILGAIRIMQPVHGYDVRRELVSWRIEEVANVKTGSIYSAIRTLERDGCIAVHSREEGDTAPARTTYVMTGEGEKEFGVLLRGAWWTVTNTAEPLIPALSLMPFLPRDEVVAAVGARIRQLESDLEALAFTRRAIPDGATGADGSIPEHVREILDFRSAHIQAEIDWSRGLRKRLQGGAYHFADEIGPDC